MSCCNDKSCAMEQLHARQSAMLRVVLVLNAMMFVVELGAGLMANSVSLLADSLDMLGDALVYGFSLWVVGRGPAWKARAAASKAGVMAAFGLFVLAAELVYKLIIPQPPGFETMGVDRQAGACRQYLVLRPAVAAPRRGHQHALGVAVLAQ